MQLNIFGTFLLDQSMNTHILSPLQLVVMFVSIFKSWFICCCSICCWYFQILWYWFFSVFSHFASSTDSDLLVAMGVNLLKERV